MKELNKSYINTIDYPVKVLQFGEGNFLRGFVDWMIHRTNQKGLFKGKVRIIQPLKDGLIDMLNDQDGLYTLISRGIKDGETISQNEIISSVEKGINPYRDFDQFIESADLPELRFIISNTTEAGIAYRNSESINDKPQISFPGKLTSILYRRFKTFNGAIDKGLIIIPCELIDRNGDNLKRIVLQLAEEWKLGDDFIKWLNEANDFLNTLVDRIVTGYPKDEVEKLTKEFQYKDNLIDTAEVFNLWVIEGDSKYSEEFPLKQAGCNVIWTDDMTPYRTRKVRILNGLHTMTCMTAHLYGIDTVGNCLKDGTINKYIEKGLYEEIIPAVDFDKDELTSFATAVLERFANPFIEHQLMSITLNSVSKFKARVLPTILEFIQKTDKAPEVLSCSLASLLHFYKGENEDGIAHKVSDNESVLEKFNSLWHSLSNTFITEDEFVISILSDSNFWGEDLSIINTLKERVLFYFKSISENGIVKTLKDLV